MSEHRPSAGTPPEPAEPSPDEAERPHAERLLSRALDDLRLQQVEIELQNEELRRAADRQQLLARSYAALFELAPVGTLELTATGGVARCNQRACEIFPGLRAGASFADLPIEPEAYRQLKQVVAFAEQAGRAAGSLERSGRSYRVDVVVIASTAERRTLLSLTDTTEQVIARRAAEHAASQLRAILDGSRDGVVVLHEGVVLYANEAWLALTSARPPLLGSIFDEVIDGQSLTEKLRAAAVSDPPRVIDVRLGEGSAHEVLAELSAVCVEYEARACLLITARDLTARRRLEAQMARSERLSSLGTLVAGVAHEINNPLTYGLANLESLLPWIEAHGSLESLQMLHDALDGFQRIAAIMRELRSFYRSDEHLVTLLDVNQVARDAARFVAPKCAALARIELELGEVPRIAGVQTGLVQVLINLIVNAVDAMPPRDAQENVVCVRTGCRGRDVRIEVSDNGRGMPSEVLGRIFEPFFSRGKAGGSGLGLTISRNLVEQMNGWIDVDSRVGTGTRFIVHFEAATANPLPAPPQSPEVSGEALSQSRVLVVDDEPLVARSVSRLLASAREVQAVSSVAAALDLLSLRPEIDLVIVDWVMPDGGAPALIAELDARGRGDLPVVVMTGLGQLGTQDIGERQCIAKPVTRQLLLRAATQALQNRRNLRESAVFGEGPESAAFLLEEVSSVRRGSKPA